MSNTIDMFCTVASREGMLTERQTLILREICFNTQDPAVLATVAAQCGLTPDAGPLTDLAAQISRQVAEETSAQPAPRTPSTTHALPDDLEWFCRLGTTEGLFTSETCACVLSSFEGTRQLATFVQTLLDYALADNPAAIQALAQRATDLARSGPPP